MNSCVCLKGERHVSIQSYQPTWNQHEDPARQEVQFQRARDAINSVDWCSLPDFDAIMDAGKRSNLMGMGTPARYGGLGLSTRQLSRLFRQFERLDTTSSHSVGYYNTLGVMPLLFAGVLDLGGFVERVARGEALGSFVLTEPQGGSHMRGMHEMARKAGTDWRLNGTKTYIAHAQAADFFLVCARSREDLQGLRDRS